MIKSSIIVASLPGTGKTELAAQLAFRYKIPFYDGGDILKAIAKELGYQNTDQEGFWESPPGLEFLERRKSNPIFDRRMDEEWMRRLDTEICTGTSWTMPWLYTGPVINLWLTAPIEIRAKRVSKRDGISTEAARNILKIRDRENINVYRNTYGIEFGEDLTPFHEIIDLTKDIDEKLLRYLDQRFAQIIAKRKIR